jgi:glycosyltransferase involved in cell wall biosynthesis
MSISVVVYCSQSPLLAERHLLHSLIQQQEVSLEVLVYYEQGVSLPGWLPAEWHAEMVDRETSVAEVWKRGCARAQNDWIAFAEPEAFYHRLHFATALKFLANHSQADGVYAHSKAVDRELYPLPHNTPHLKTEDWKGFFLSEDCPVPFAAFLFKRASLADVAWDTLAHYYLEEQLLVDWLDSHSLIEMPVASVSGIPQRNRLMPRIEQAEEFIQLYHGWLEKYPPQELVLASAFPAAKSESFALQAILQALYNRGLLEEARLFREKHLQALYSLQSNTVLWVVPEQESLPATVTAAWQALVAQGHHPVLVRMSAKTLPQQVGVHITYRFREGMSEVDICNFSEEQQDHARRGFSQDILVLLKQLVELYQPERVHFTSFRLASLHMAPYLAELNIPVFYSLADHSALALRQMLRKPNQESQWQIIRREQAERLNQLLQRLFELIAVRIFVEQPADLALLEDLGLKTETVQLISSAEDILAAYGESAVTRLEHKVLPSFGLLYQVTTGKTLADNMQADQDRFLQCRQVLAVGTEEKQLVRSLNSQNVPASVLESSLEGIEQGLEQGIQMLEGGPESLGKFLHIFDGLHSAYTLERFSPAQLVRFLQDCNLAMEKGGKLVLRFLNAANANVREQGLWLDEAHQRPYPAMLLEILLKHCGFQLIEAVSEEEGWQDGVIEAFLKFPSLPLLNTPVSTQAFAEYWKGQLFSVDIPEDAKVLLIGPHIQNSWLMYRVQCERMLGISLNLAEITPKFKPRAAHQIHYSRNILKTLNQLKGQFDVILWQGLPETLLPHELQKVLARTRQLLTPAGKLHIQTLQLEADSSLFWECLLNRRPYPELDALLQEYGFDVKASKQRAQHHTYDCSVLETIPTQALTPLDLPPLAQWLSERSEQAWRPNHPGEISRQETASQSFILLDTLLQEVPPDYLQLLLRHVMRILKPGGEVLLRLDKYAPEFWQNNRFCRPYPERVASKFLQENGFVRSQVWEHNNSLIWYGRKLQDYQPRLKDPQALPVLWQGDIFNYHSLSLVNRHLTAALLKHPGLQLEVKTFSDPSFTPEPDSDFADLATCVYRPLIDPPAAVVRHHWPPDFEPPTQPGHWVMIQPWEFGSIPERWIYNMNKFVDQVWVPSHFVRDCYVDSGLIPEKVVVVPNGVNTALFHPKTPPLLLETSKTFRFLFVGGGILRKGIDILLQAFVETFTDQDNVSLVLKEFGAGTVYEALDIPTWLESCKESNPHMPEILHLTDELSLEEMPSLYTACDCLVHPYRGEGFGLPIAEAMASELPVIVTDFGACLDFCNAENAYLIPAEKKQFAERQVDQTLITVDYPFWGEPDLDAFKALLKHVYNNRKEAKAKGRKARKTIIGGFSWELASEIAQANLRALATRPVFRFQRTQIIGQALGEALQAFSNQDYAPAIEKFSYALQVDPYQPDVAYNLGVAYMMQQDYELALKYLSQSLREGECTADLCYAMGTTLRHLGDHETAQEFHTKARELDPGLFAGAT